MGQDLSLFRVLFETKSLLVFLNCHTVCGGPTCSISPPLLPISMWLLHILSYRNSLQLVFMWFSEMVAM